MTETSAMWDGTVTGDAATYAAAYCADEVARYQRGLTCLVDRTSEGPIYTEEAAYNGQCEATNPAGIQIQVDTGRALVNGWIYESDAAVTLNPGSGDGFYRVVLQLDTTTQTVRAALIYNAIATPSLTQNEPGVWEIALANFEINGGAITAAGVVDERDFVNAKTVRLFVPALVGYNVTGASDVAIQTTPNYSSPHVPLAAAAQGFAYGYFGVDENFITDMTIEAVVVDDLGGASGTVSVINYWQSGDCGEQDTNTSQNTGAVTPTIGAVGSRLARVCIASLSVLDANVDPGDVVKLALERQNAGTYAGTLKVVGWNVNYLGYRR